MFTKEDIIRATDILECPNEQAIFLMGVRFSIACCNLGESLLADVNELFEDTCAKIKHQAE